MKLTARQEKEIQALAEWLASAPSEWVLAVFEEPAPPKERPEMWC